MRNRQLILIGSAGIALVSFCGYRGTRDTITSASERFGKAVLASDTATIWSFVPEDERQYYDLNESKFAQYWRKIVAPHLTSLDSYELDAAGTNGIEVVALNSKDPTNLHKFSLLVSGQNGRYYVPYILATAGLHSCTVDSNLKSLSKVERFTFFSQWTKEVEGETKALGFHMFRRGPLFQGETLKGMSEHFKDIADNEAARIKFATR